jgi:hypothetical protein
VVGVTSFPPDFGTGGLGTGAVFDFAGFGARCAQGTAPGRCAIDETYSGAGVILVDTASSAAGRSALNRLVATYEGDVSLPMAPANLVNFGQALNFPVLLGSVLIIFGVATLLYVLVLSVSRRRQEIRLLKSLLPPSLGCLYGALAGHHRGPDRARRRRTSRVGDRPTGVAGLRQLPRRGAGADRDVLGDRCHRSRNSGRGQPVGRGSGHRGRSEPTGDTPPVRMTVRRSHYLCTAGALNATYASQDRVALLHG